MADDAEIGKVGWIDITVDDATGLRDFYSTSLPDNAGNMMAARHA